MKMLLKRGVAVLGVWLCILCFAVPALGSMVEVDVNRGTSLSISYAGSTPVPNHLQGGGHVRECRVHALRRF